MTESTPVVAAAPAPSPPQPRSLASFARRYWQPLLAFIALAACCTDTNYDDGRRLAVWLSGAGNKIFIASVALFLLCIALKKRAFWPLRRGVEFGVLCTLMVNVLRFATRLPRPPHRRHGVIVQSDEYSLGFPSSHTAFAFGLAWLILEINPPFAPLWFAVAVAIGWSRIELFAHYPYQVLCGAILGSLLAYGISHAPHGVLAWLRERFAARHEAAPQN